MIKLMTKYMLRPVLTIVGALMFLASCAVKAPEGVLTEQKMEDVLMDYHTAKALGTVKKNNKTYDRDMYIKYVLEKHNVTEAQFDSSVAWYTRHIVTYTKIYNRVDKRISAQKASLDKLVALRTHKAQKSLKGDSIDVWYLQRNLLMSSMPAENRLTFDLSSDGNFADKDSMWWRVHAIVLHKDSVVPTQYIPRDTLEVAVNDSVSRDSVVYDTIVPVRKPYAVMQLEMQYPHRNIAQAIKIDTTGWYNIKLQANDLGRLRKVKGFIYMSRMGLFRPAMLVDSIQLIRLHQSTAQAKQIADSLQAIVDREQAVKDSIKAAKAKKVEKKAKPTKRLSPQERRRLKQVKKIDEVK